MRYTTILAAILASGGSVALAQQRAATAEVVQDRVVVATPTGRDVTRIVTKDGQRTIELTLESNTVREIKIDGKPAPAHTARVEKDRILLFAPSGREEASIPFRWEGAAPPPPPEVAARSMRARAIGAEPAPTISVTGAATIDPNRRVIGITTGAMNEVLAAQFNLDPEAVIVVNAVTDGLPAAKAGVQRFDIITKIEGQPPATVARLRETLRAKGESPVSLTVLRGGKELVLKVDSVPEATGEFTWSPTPGAQGGSGRGAPDAMFRAREQLTDEQRKRLEESMLRLREVGAQNQERLAQVQEQFARRMAEVGQRVGQRRSDEGVLGDAKRAYETVVRELQSININEQIERAMADRSGPSPTSTSSANSRAPEVRFLGTGADRRDVVIVPGAPAAPVAPAAPSAPAAVAPARPVAPASSAEDARLRALEERMARIERLLERLAESRGN